MTIEEANAVLRVRGQRLFLAKVQRYPHVKVIELFYNEDDEGYLMELFNETEKNSREPISILVQVSMDSHKRALRQLTHWRKLWKKRAFRQAVRSL